MTIGFIGAGSMGSLLIRSFIRAGAIRQTDVIIHTRTPARMAPLLEQYPALGIAFSNQQVARSADYLFLCIKPLDYYEVLSEIRPSLRADQVVVTITSPVMLAHLEELIPCQVAKIVPSVVNAVGSGAALCMWGARITQGNRQVLQRLFSAISRPIDINESSVRAASDLSSCGPAFMAYLLEQFIHAAAAQGMNLELAQSLASEMLLGTARLLLEYPYTTEELQAKVCVPGGITAAALDVLREATEGAFTRVLQMTHEKFADDLNRVEYALFPQKRT